MSISPTYSGKTAYRGGVAADYEKDRVDEPVWKMEQEWVARWAGSVPEGAQLLDVPVGSGRFVPIWLARGIKVSGVDISDDMLAEVRRREFAGHPDLKLMTGDAEALACTDSFFDFVICWRLFHLLPPTVANKVVGEFARVCRGRIILEVFGVAPKRNLLGWLKGFLRRFFRRASSKAASPWAHIENFMHSEEELRAMFDRAKLRVISAETLAEYNGVPARVYILERVVPTT